MRREHETGYGRERSPEQRYADFAKENEAWDRKVKRSIEKIKEASRRKDRARQP